MDTSYYKKFEPIFGSWYIKELLGEGSYGCVFAIERYEKGETYKAALKAISVPKHVSEIKSNMADGMSHDRVKVYYDRIYDELRREINSMVKLKGESHIVSYEDHLLHDHEDGIGGDIFIRMELLTPLNDYILNNKVTKRDIIRLGIDMCDALELCQKQGIIHRDIKPENIFVSDTGNFKLGDFGIAAIVEKEAKRHTSAGTEAYMAPEVHAGRDYDATVDLYSLGIVLYKLLNNNRGPFLPAYPHDITGKDREIALEERLKGTNFPTPLYGTGKLGEIVLKACAYVPQNRYQNASALRVDLEAVLNEIEDADSICSDEPTELLGSIGYATQFTPEHIELEKTDRMGIEEDLANSNVHPPKIDKTYILFKEFKEDNKDEIDKEEVKVEKDDKAEPREILNLEIDEKDTKEDKEEEKSENGADKKKVVAPNKKKSSKVPIIVAACIILAVIIGLIFFMTTGNKEKVTIEGIKDEITLTVGESYTLKPIIKPEGIDVELSYSSDNEDVALVTEKGKIKAKTEGTATIQIIAGNVKKEVKVIVESKETVEREDYTDYTYYENEDEEIEQPDNKEETVTDNSESTDGTGEVGAEEELPPEDIESESSEEMGEVSDVENEEYEEFAPEDSVQIRVEE